MCGVRGPLVVSAEVSVVVTALRRGARPAPEPDVSRLEAQLLRLRSGLCRATDLRPLDPNLYFGPFLAVIRSDKTAATVTGLALAAVNKFLSYGLMDPTHPSVPATVENIADAVTHARFVGTDHSSDGVVLMKILQVLRTLMLSPEGAMLTGDSVCEIMLSCFRICFETRLSELLRRNADQCLRDMIQLVFMRLPQFSASSNLDADSNLSSETLTLKKRTNSAKRDRQNIKNERSQSQVIDNTRLNSTSSNLMVSKNLANSGQTAKVLNIQENISRTTHSVDDSDAKSILDTDQTPEQDKSFPVSISDDVTITQSVIKSPSKKHGRHSSMDLASSDNIFISQLVEKCVNPSENMDQVSEYVLDKESDIQEIEVNNENETQPLLISSENEAITDKVENDAIDGSDNTLNSETIEKTDDGVKCESDKDFINPRGVKFIQYDEQVNLQPYGLACVRELLRFLISLCNPMDTQNSSSMVYLGLCLVETALEVAADHLAQHPSILQLIKDPLCRNLLSLLDSERVSIFALDLQVSFLLFESLRTHLKFQMQSFFTKLIEIIMSDNSKNSYELKEITYLSLDSIAQMWKIPGLCTEIYLNYDCDVYSSNMFEDITKLLSKSIVAAGVNDYHALALDALYTVIESIEANCRQIKSSAEVEQNEEEEYVNKDDSSIDSRGRKRYISIDMEDCEDMGDESVIHDISQYITSGKSSRHKISSNLPTQAQLVEIKNRKKWIAKGTEHFNQKPEKGIEYLLERGILSTPLDPLEIAHFLRNNPALDKKMIGEYISKKKNVESRILATYAASFDMTGLRVDQALRLYLETFRLPGEAPLIFLVMEHFAEHWHKCNGNPFANTDAAFRLAYAVIMLNMDQHNHNAKKLNIPMTIDDFVKNLRGCNGSNDFDQKMLEATFNSIKNEEIVMPAEHTGIVKENYLWKVLLRRGATKEGIYYHCPNGAYDVDLFTLTWGPLIAALSSLFEKSNESQLYCQALEGFDKCASIVGYFNLTNELDTLILSLCKFTGLFNLPDQSQYIYIGTTLGQSMKAQLALKKVFSVCHRHTDSIREGWKHILEVVLALFKGHLLPKSLTEADDFCSPTGKISLIQEPSQQTKMQETGLFSSLYSYIALSSESNALRNPNPEEAELIQIASEGVAQCNIDTMLLTDSKFLQLDSLQELVKYLIAAGKVDESQTMYKPSYTDDTTVFFLELLIKIVIQNRDRVSHVWLATETYVTDLMKSAAAATQLTLTEKMTNNFGEKFSPGVNNRPSGLLERSAIGLLKLAINLMRSEECASDVLHSLNSFLDLSYPVYHYIASQIAVGLFELVKTSAQNIHSRDDWALVFTLLETTGAGAMHLKQDECLTGNKSDGALSSEDDSVSTDRGYTSEGELSHSPPTQGWILVGNNADGVQTSMTNLQQTQMEGNPLIHPCALRPHDPYAMLKCWECLAFIVRDVAHITPYNFASCVNCIRTFVEASLHGTNQSKITTTSNMFVNKDGKRKKQTSHIKKMQKQQEMNEKLVKSAGINQEKDVPDGYQLISIQLLDLMHTLHSRTAQIFKWWREESNLTNSTNMNELNSPVTIGMDWCNLWHLAWQPLLQGIARLCTDNRRQVSNSAVTYLQRALLVHDLQTLSGEEWEICFHCVLFPLLSRLTKHNDDIRLRANTIMCKVFLHHLTPLLSRPSFPSLWLSLLDLMRSLMTGSHTTDLLYEATLESLKNMLLVMDSVKVFSDGDTYTDLWNITWNMISSFLPKLKDELFKSYENPKAAITFLNPEQNVPEAVSTPSSPVQPPKVLPPPVQQLKPSITNPALNQTATDSQKPIINNNASLIQNPIFTSNILNTGVQNPPNVNPIMKGSSIILQPPAIGSQVHSPLFSHLGQMVSTPIGVAVPVSSQKAPPVPILYPTPLPQKYCNVQITDSSVSQAAPTNSSFLISPCSTNLNLNTASSQFTLVSPHASDSNQQQAANQNRTPVAQPSLFERSALSDGELALKNLVQQPQSLYGEYITNPYNSLPPATPEDAYKSTAISQNDYINASFILNSPADKNLNYASLTDIPGHVAHDPHVALAQKSQSVTSSPLHAATPVNTNFVSSDNIKNISNQENLDSSGMFSFSKYFYSDSTNIPPGSEILFGNTINH